MDKRILTNSIENVDEITQAKREALDRAYAYQTSQIALQSRQELLSAKQSYMPQMEYVTERYKLERDEIDLTIGKTREQKDALIEASKVRENIEVGAIKDAAFAAFSSAFQIDDEAQRQNQYDAELAQQAELLNQQLVTYEEYLQAKAEITKRYNDAESSLRLSQAGETLGSFAGMFKNIQGEQSTAYRVMFAAQKGFAIAQSVMAIQAAMASSAMSLPFPANLGAIATVAAQMASIVSTISSVQPQGFANGGYTGAGGKYDPAGIVHKGEVVWSQADIKRSGGVANVEALRKGSNASTGGNVVINNYGDNSVSTERNNNGDLVVTIQKEIDRYVPAQLSNPNSRISKSLGQNTQTMRKR
ncbi:MAG: hypothetical protein EOO68_10140 [Moraxellaceae bacterium]|nr:MAG: hypothetical protein EOO68_10140 [Moraxellaceae bacterium]